MVPKPVRNFFISLGVRQSIRIASLEQISHFTRPQTCQESLKKGIGRADKNWKDLSELKPFRRNIQTIIDLARLQNIAVVLTTHARSVKPQLAQFGATQIDQCNAIIRELHELNPETLFVDLDQMMTGKLEHVFRDLGHVIDEGKQFEAERISEAIIAHLKETSRLP